MPSLDKRLQTRVRAALSPILQKVSSKNGTTLRPGWLPIALVAAVMGRGLILLPAQVRSVAEATLDRTRKEHLNSLVTAPLPILENFGLHKLPLTAGEELIELIMRRYERASTPLTSSRLVEYWGKDAG